MRDIDPQVVCLDHTPFFGQSILRLSITGGILAQTGLTPRWHESILTRPTLAPYGLMTDEEIGLIPARLMHNLLAAAYEKTSEPIHILWGGGLTALAFIKFLSSLDRIPPERARNLSDVTIAHMNHYPQPVHTCTLLLAPDFVCSALPGGLAPTELPPWVPSPDYINLLNACFRIVLDQNPPPILTVIDLTHPQNSNEQLGQETANLTGLFARSLITSLGS